jgi:hypothetical protein
LQAQQSETNIAELNWWGTLWQHEYHYMSTLALALPVLQQASGAAAVLLMSSQVFPDLAFPDELPVFWSCVAVGGTCFLFTALAQPLADALGR